MGGSTKQVQDSTQRTNQTAVNSPWAPAQPYLTQILGQAGGQAANSGLTGAESGALANLSSVASRGNQFLPQINQLASDLFSGGTDRTGYVTRAYDEARAGLLPYANSNTNPYQNEAFTKATGYMSDDITNRINSAYAGAGYSPTGAGDYGRQIGEGISRGVAPTWLQAYNDMEGRKLGAINSLYSAGGQTAGLLSGLDQTALGNRQAGVGVSGSAMTAAEAPYLRQLEIEAQRRGIPMQNLAQAANLIVPMAQLGGTTNQTGTTTGQTTSQTQVPMLQQLAGGLLGGAGLIGQTGGFGPSGWLTNAFKWS